MKKLFAFALLLSIGMFTFAGCGETKKDKTGGGEPSKTAEKDKPK